MNSLTVDIGNTNVKASIWNDEGELIYHSVSQSLPYGSIGKKANSFNVEKTIVASTKGDDEIIGKELASFTRTSVLIFNQEEIQKLSSRSRYESTIGPDRIAAFLGAEKIYPHTGKLIIDAGTAITMDVVDKDGFFCGGDISLGLMKRLETLHKSTALLPDVKVDMVLHPFGIDTRSAILNGAIYGILGEMLFAFQRAKKNYQTEKIILTGGDAETFGPMLKEHGIDCEYRPLLVEEGLDFHLRMSGN